MIIFFRKKNCKTTFLFVLDNSNNIDKRCFTDFNWIFGCHSATFHTNKPMERVQNYPFQHGNILTFGTFMSFTFWNVRRFGKYLSISFDHGSFQLFGLFYIHVSGSHPFIFFSWLGSSKVSIYSFQFFFLNIFFCLLGVV